MLRHWAWSPDSATARRWASGGADRPIHFSPTKSGPGEWRGDDEMEKCTQSVHGGPLRGHCSVYPLKGKKSGKVTAAGRAGPLGTPRLSHSLGAKSRAHGRWRGWGSLASGATVLRPANVRAQPGLNEPGDECCDSVRVCPGPH